MHPHTDDTAGRHMLRGSTATASGSITNAAAASDVAALRAQIYRDTCDEKELAAALGKDPRTIKRYIAQGMPVIRGAGREKRFYIESIRGWLLATERRHGEVRRGRPRKHAV